MGEIYQQCPHCCAHKIAEYQLNLDCYNPTSIDGEDNDNTIPRTYCTNNPNRGTLIHMQSYNHSSLAKARKISNEHIEQKLNQLYDTAMKGQREACVIVTDDTQSL